ncbi:23984_t:CDS:2, partial [Racocetra persica]
MSLVEPNSGTSTPLESTQSESETNCDLSRKKIRKGGPAFDKVWDYVIKGEKVNPEHYKTEYFHVERPGRENIPEDIQQYWVNKLAEENNSHKRDSQLQVTLPPQ